MIVNIIFVQKVEQILLSAIAFAGLLTSCLQISFCKYTRPQAVAFYGKVTIIVVHSDIDWDVRVYRFLCQ